MALTDEGGMVMPVAPAYGGGFGNSGFGGDGWWIILLFILLANNGWGGYGMGGFGGAIADGAMLYPWMNQADITTSGFQNQALGNQLTGIQASVNDVSTQLCNGFATVNATVNNGFANAEVANNARQIANMQTAFNAQTAMTQGFNGLQGQLAQCCCDNRLASADLKYTIATENCADRAAISDGIRDLLTSQNANTQRILDQLCADKIEQKNDTIAQLRSELMYARGQASQDVQTAQILANNAAQTAALEQYLNPAPIPAYVVQNPNCCTNTCGCGI